ncbi:MAG: ABC transporter permease [Clostridiales bacterium]|nr:ABC transporter permease [Clostridiales bacterium]
MRQTVKKVISTLITLLIVSFLLFLAFELIPGDPALAKLGTEATPEQVAQLREKMGLDRPLLERYASWVWSFFQGDFGISYDYGIPVASMVLDKLPITLTMTGMAFLIMLLLSIPMGIFTAKHSGGRLDSVLSSINQVVMSIPSFFTGILIMILFGIILRLFTPGNFVSYKEDWGRFLSYMLFPSVAVALPKAAMAVKMLRSALLTELKHDYTRTAYSRGNNTSGVLYRHVLKNAFIPVLTFFGMALADIFTGSIIVEQVFHIPGLGRILLTAISHRDYPVVEAIIMLMAAVVILVNLIVDLIYRKIDPRISAEG